MGSASRLVGATAAFTRAVKLYYSAAWLRSFVRFTRALEMEYPPVKSHSASERALAPSVRPSSRFLGDLHLPCLDPTVSLNMRTLSMGASGPTVRS